MTRAKIMQASCTGCRKAHPAHPKPNAAHAEPSPAQFRFKAMKRDLCDRCDRLSAPCHSRSPPRQQPAAGADHMNVVQLSSRMKAGMMISTRSQRPWPKGRSQLEVVQDLASAASTAGSSSAQQQYYEFFFNGHTGTHVTI